MTHLGLPFLEPRLRLCSSTNSTSFFEVGVRSSPNNCSSPHRVQRSSYTAASRLLRGCPHRQALTQAPSTIVQPLRDRSTRCPSSACSSCETYRHTSSYLSAIQCTTIIGLATQKSFRRLYVSRRFSS